MKKSHNCPSCGGPLQLDIDQPIPKCPYCGSTLRLTEAEGELAVEVHVRHVRAQRELILEQEKLENLKGREERARKEKEQVQRVVKVAVLAFACLAAVVVALIIYNKIASRRSAANYQADLASLKNEGYVVCERNSLLWSKPSTEGITRKNSENYCSDLVSAGYDDWRLPSSQEFLTCFPDIETFNSAGFHNEHGGLRLKEKYEPVLWTNQPASRPPNTNYVGLSYWGFTLSDEYVTNQDARKRIRKTGVLVYGSTAIDPPETVVCVRGLSGPKS